MMNVGMVGCGMVAERQYLPACGALSSLNLVACADLHPERAEAFCRKAAEENCGTPETCTFEEMLARDDIDLVMNLTNPKAHFALNRQALDAGKHVYAEKPLAVTREEGQQLVELAARKGVQLGCAPDTFLGSSHQTARALLDSGTIGTPTAAVLSMVGGGPDGYHDDADLFFQRGAGPLMDNGVYPLTNAVNLLGPVRRVSAMTKITFPERTILKEKRYGEKFKVEVPTHVTAVLEFENGVLGTFINSFDVKGAHHVPRLEIYGTEGSLAMGDPNSFNGAPEIALAADRKAGWQAREETHGYGGRYRGVGGAELANAVAAGRPARASGELAYHVLDICCSIYEAADSGRCVEVQSRVERPDPLPEGVVDDMV